MAAFHEVRFPEDISKGSAGGPQRRTDIVTLVSGFEERNAAQAHSRRSYDASLGIRSVDDLHDVITFWEARLGQLYGFRWKDWSDFKSGRPGRPTTATDQVLGVGNGVLTTFQLRKVYSSGPTNYARPIQKPVAGTVKVAVDGTPMGSGWSVNTVTGLITFDSAPADTKAVTAGFEFDVPVRFGADKLSVSVDAFEAGSISAIDIQEIRV